MSNDKATMTMGVRNANEHGRAGRACCDELRVPGKSGKGKRKGRRYVKHVERAAWRAEVDRMIYGDDED